MYMPGAFRQSQEVGFGQNKGASVPGDTDSDPVQMANGLGDMTVEVGREGSVYHRKLEHTSDPCKIDCKIDQGQN